MDELQFQALVRRTRDKTQRRALANQQGGVKQEQPKLSRPLLRPESEVVELSKVSGTFPTEAPLVGSWPVGWRGASRNSWGQRTPRGLAGARCLTDCSSKSSRRAILCLSGLAPPAIRGEA